MSGVSGGELTSFWCFYCNRLARVGDVSITNACRKGKDLNIITCIGFKTVSVVRIAVAAGSEECADAMWFLEPHQVMSGTQRQRKIQPTHPSRG